MTTPSVATPEPKPVPPSGDTARTAARPGRFRYWVILCLSSVVFMPMLDRIAISVLLTDPVFLTVTDMLGDPIRQGWIITGFVIPYAVFNVLLGPVIDRIGGRRLVSLMVGSWLVLSLAFVAVRGFFPALLVRAVRGICESPLYPVMTWFVKFWVPARERGLANAIWLSAAPLGHTVGVPFVALLFALGGYQTVIIVVALVSTLISGPLVWFFVSNRPTESRWVGAAERELIVSDQEPERPKSEGFFKDAKVFAADYHYWLLVVQHICYMAVYWALIGWLPKYLIEARGFSTIEMDFYYSMFFLISVASTVVAGHWSDRFYRRAPLMSVVMATGGAAMLFATLVDGAVLAAWSLVAANALLNASSPNYYAILQRIIPARVMGAGVGLDNGITNFLGSTTPAIIGYLIAFGAGYQAGLLMLAGIFVVGALSMLVLTVEGY